MSDEADLSIVHFQSLVEPDDRPATGDAQGDATIERLGPDGVDELEALWRALVDHHTALDGAVPFRHADDSWPRLRGLYLEILEDQEAFCLVARRAGRAVAYAIVKIEGPEHVWKTGDRLAELETLVVAESERGSGLGSRMMDLIESELASRGIDDLLIGVEAPNSRAQDFYERRGYAHAFTWLYGKPKTMCRGDGPGRTPK